jgi:iron complex transport system substrate-binding protein
MRIVSLLPAATEIVLALGLADDLVGVTDACAAMPETSGVRIVARRVARGPGTGPAAPPFDVDDAGVVDLRPDLVLAPGWWRPERAGIDRPAEAMDRGIDGPTVVILAPSSIEGVLHAISTVGAMTSSEDAALDLVEDLRERLADVEESVERRRAAGHAPPRVVALDGLDPLLAAGRWVPEQIRRAGGWDLLGREGEEAAPTSWEAVQDLDPEMLLLMPRGADLAGTLAAWEGVSRPAGWDEIHAVRRGQVFALDAAACFGDPGPGVIDGIELLAELFDPVGFVDVAPPGGWVPVD